MALGTLGVGLSTTALEIVAEVEVKVGSTNDAFRFFPSTVWEEFEVDVVERATTALTVLPLIACRTFALSSALAEKINGRD